ncbi:D-alanyl-D-alanine carboxypeptidase, partial [Kitasatospora sp. NPDC059571]|uniref:D-alanyl-D-alanine carboxypeptidase n=1 Tax=Kitasatospora sp. NPDC059571 TaxID=3346871 RepID=UPI0036BD3DB9
MPARLHRRALPMAAAALAASLLAGSAQADSPAPADPTLTADLDALLSDARLANAQAGVQVLDAATGQVLYQHQADALLTPASTLKTVTTAAALDLLGADHRFTTEVRTTGTREGGRLNGDLVLVWGGGRARRRRGAGPDQPLVHRLVVAGARGDHQDRHAVRRGDGGHQRLG